ncbi:uncharacterized protein [Aegilops tauschii subsp. strangulata]|uniref:uncharacterized protein n=1 Tax=Aegilops tauschii subsp. strangulata TaxID=200361 RepID=UPI003CC886F9
MAVARVSSLDLERAMAVHVRGGGERPYGAAHIDREKLEPQRVHGAIAVTAGGAWAAETSGSVQPSRRRPATLESKAGQHLCCNIFAALDRLYIRGGGHGLRCRVHDEALEG